MSRLRKTFTDQIHNALNDSRFTADDFLCEYPDTGEVLISINFIEDEEYKFTVENFPDGLRLHIVPGNVMRSEYYPVVRIEDTIYQIKGWCNCIVDEMKAKVPNMIYKEIEDMRDNFKKNIEEHVKDENTHFSIEEKKNINITLQSLIEKFQELENKQTINDGEMKKIAVDINSIRENLSALPKGAWYRTAANKMVTMVEKVFSTKEGKELAVEVVRDLISGPK